MDALRTISPAPIYFVDIPDGKNGCYGHAQNEVYVSWCIAPAMMIRTTLHEMAHAILHPWPGEVKPEDELPRAIRETEAEGAAYLVCLHYGLADLKIRSLGALKVTGLFLLRKPEDVCYSRRSRIAPVLLECYSKSLPSAIPQTVDSQWGQGDAGRCSPGSRECR